MKKMIVNCAMCDMRQVSEETLQTYETITVNAATVLVTSETKELLNRYSVALNAAEVLEVPEGENVRISTQNGAYELTSDGAPKEGDVAILMVNGSLTVGPDALEAAMAYQKIRVNGTVLLPKSMAGKLNNLSVNGRIDAYPDGAILLKRNAVIDKTFPLRTRKNALYWAARRLVFLDGALNVQKLMEKGVRFAGREALLSEALAESVTPLLAEDTEITVVPDGTVFINDDVKMNRRFLKRYGPKAYINGDLIVEPDAGELLRQIEHLYVNGDVKLPEELAEAFDEIDASYGELVLLKKAGKIIEEQVKVKLDRALLERYPDGILVSECAMVRLAEDIPPALILERLSFSECAMVHCTEEQEAAVAAVSREVAMIGPEQENQPGSRIKDMVLDIFDPNVKMVNAAEYVM